MSYFCANSISINKKDKTCRVKGGDNNVTPRTNSWTGYFNISTLIGDISGGTLQFTHRKDKNIYVEKLAFEYAKKIKDLSGMNAWEVTRLVLNPKQDFELYSKVKEHDWNYNTAQSYLKFLSNGALIFQIKNLQSEFTERVLAMDYDKRSYVIQHKNSGNYVSKKYKRSLATTHDRGFAKKFSKIKAEDVLKNYNKKDFEIILIDK